MKFKLVENLENLQEDVDVVEELSKATPYMLRNDGKLIECSPMHPYIRQIYDSDEKCLDKLSTNRLWCLKWFFENTQKEVTRKNIKIVVKYLVYNNKVSDENLNAFEIDDDTYLSSEEEVFDFIDIVKNDTNQEFLRVRTSSMLFGGNNNSIYFRISSVGYNWFDLIWSLVYRYRKSISDITIVKDSNTFGGKFTNYIVDGKDITNMSTDEFITFSGNPIIESINRSNIEAINEAIKCFNRGDVVSDAFIYLHPRYANGYYDRIVEDFLEDDIKNILRKKMKFKLVEKKKRKNKKHQFGFFTTFLPDKEKGIYKFNQSVDFGKVDGDIDGGVTADGGNAVSESLENISDFIDKAEVILVDDAENFDINQWERDLQKEIDEEIEEETEEQTNEEKFVKYKIDDATLKKVVDKLSRSDFSTLDGVTSWKTKQFLKKNNLTLDDLQDVLRNIKEEEYKTNSIPSNKNEGYNEAIIFLKTAKIKELEPMRLYIKLDYDNIEETPVIIISVHKSGKVKEESISESVEEDRLTRLFNECVSELRRIGYQVDDDIDIKFNNAKSFFGKTTTIPDEDDRFVITFSKHLNKETDEFIKDIIYHELAHYLTSKKAIKETVLKKDRFGEWSIFPMLKKYYTQHGEIWKKISDDICSKLNCHIERVHDSDTTDDIYNEDIRNEEMDKKEALKCLEEFEEEETAKCVWCGDEFPVDELNREKDMGYICDHCRRGLESRGEEIEFEEE